MLGKYRYSRRGEYITLAVMAAVMLLFNILTKRLADDYEYYFSFATGEPIGSLGELIDSIIMHGKYLNGRYFSHFFAQLFLSLPDLVFDLFNSAVFILTVFIPYRVAKRGECDNFLLVGIFSAIWLFEWDFGQINLWCDGACNYLFSLLFGLLFLLPFISYMRDGRLPTPLVFPLHILSGFLIGGWLEPAAVGFIGAAVYFVLCDLIIFKSKRALAFIPSILAGGGGFLLMSLAPAQLTNKLSEFSFMNILATFGVALLIALSTFPLIILYIKLLKQAKEEKTDPRATVTSLVVFAGALSANFVMVFAKYYALRCSVAYIFMLIFAVALLFGSVKNTEFGKASRKVYKLFAVAMALALTVGLADNAMTFVTISENESIIAEAKEAGETELTLRSPIGFTKYNAKLGIKYLDSERGYWPNKSFAKYHGLEGVTGINPLRELLIEWGLEEFLELSFLRELGFI